MRAQLNDDSEDEYLDDPIKLFDFEHERVHFGSQPLQCSNTSTYASHRSENSVLIENNAVLSETLDGPDINVEHFCENDCLPSSVKLVDCGKYPWYYKKYSQQILNKLNIFNLVSDEDGEEDNSDCIIVEDIIDQLDRNIKDYSSKILPEIICKTALEKRQETMKLKEDIEIQIALSLKNTSEIDLKRNKGLIGIKIMQKPVTNNNVNIEINKKNKQKKITTMPKDTISTDDEEIKNSKSKTDEFVKNLPVQFSLGEMSEKLLERIIKKNNVQSRENKPEPNQLNKSNDEKKSDPKRNTSKSSSLPNKVKITSVHVKETTHTNQVNTNENLDSERIARQANEKEKQKKYAREVEIDFSQNSPKRHVEDKDEPNSPILPCSSNLAKKNKSLSQITIDNKNRDIHKIKTATNKTDHNNKTVNKPVVDTSAESEIKNKASKQDEIPNSIKALKHDKISNLINPKLADDKVAKKILHKVQSVDNNIGQLSESVETYTKTFTNENGNDSKMNNDAQKLDQPNINRVVQSSVNSGVTVTFTPSIATNDCSETAPFSFKPNSFTPNSSGSEMNLNNIKFNHNAAHTSYGSAIILRPMVSVRAQSNQHNMLKEAPRMSLQLQPRFYQNPYSANYHRPPLLPLPDHRLNPRSAHCGAPNYRLPTPQEIAHPLQYYPRQFQSVGNGCYQHKDLPHWFQKGSEQHKIYPYSLTRPVLQSSLNTKSVSDPQSTNISSQSKNDIRLHNNNLVLAKNQYSDPRMLPLDSVNSDLVASKTKMLEVLDSATNNLENDITENDFTERLQEPVNTFKMPNVADKLDLTNKDDYHKLMEQQKAYTKNAVSQTISEVVANKTKMLERVLEDLKRGIDAVDTTEKVQEPANKFKRPKINKPEQVNEDCTKQIEHAGDYSPPILPIPTFQNILYRVKDVQKQDQHIMKTVSEKNKEINHNGKRMQNNTPSGNSRNSNKGRKISIEEYKMRTLKMKTDQFNNSNKNVCRSGNDKNKPNLQNKRMYNNVDRGSTESDLGYDSDSTVIL